MNNKYLVFLSFILCFTYSHCRKRKCQQHCSGKLVVAPVGFSLVELSAATGKFYYKGNVLMGTVNFEPHHWAYKNNDSTNDTLVWSGWTYTGGIEDDMWLQLTIPAASKTYIIKEIKLGGILTEEQTCDSKGRPVPGYCSGDSYLLSYGLDGVQISFPPNSNQNDIAGYIFIPK